MSKVKAVKLKETGWLLGVLIAFDQIGNALGGGSPKSTISARTGYFVQQRDAPALRYWQILEKIIDFAFYPIDGPEHCRKAFIRDLEGGHREGNDLMRGILGFVVILTCIPISILTRVYTLVFSDAHYESKVLRQGERCVQPMSEDDVEAVLDYFHQADQRLYENIGIKVSQTHDHEHVKIDICKELSKPIDERSYYTYMWKIGDVAIGHATLNPIEREGSGTLHLYLWEQMHRGLGNGKFFMRQTIFQAFELFDLKEIICEPPALNAAPNKLLSTLGFELMEVEHRHDNFSSITEPVNRWRMTRKRFYAICRESIPEISNSASSVAVLNAQAQ